MVVDNCLLGSSFFFFFLIDSCVNQIVLLNTIIARKWVILVSLWDDPGVRVLQLILKL